MTDVVMTRIENPVTGKPEIRIDRAETHVLIADEVVEDAFNEPSEMLFGRILLGRSAGAALARAEPDRLDPAGISLKMFIVINGRNRQVRYLLTRQRPAEHIWEAELVSDSA
jgi:hypothetical protein